jgi:hypothetical protein
VDGIVPGKLHGRHGVIHRDHVGFRELRGKRDGDNARPRTDIDPPAGALRSPLNDTFDKALGFRARDENAGSDPEGKRHELDFTQEVLERSALQSLEQECAKPIRFLVAHFPGWVKIEIMAFHPRNVGQQEIHLL